MPLESQLAHRNVASSALPYRTNQSPTATDPCFVTGSQDILTSIAGYCQRRPGFANFVEAVATTFNNLSRLFTWNRFDGTFIEMACDVNASGNAQVYKRVVGTDNSFVSIFTDTMGTPFDFATSNNTVYFSNGHVAKKWNPSIGVEDWGIAIGSVNNATGPDGVGTGANVNFNGNAWANPSNITAQDATYATVTLSQSGSVTVGPNGVGAAGQTGTGVAWSNVNNILTSDGSFATATGNTAGGSVSSQLLQATSFGFSIPSTASITGILVEVQRAMNATGLNVVDQTIQLLKAGNGSGSNKASGTSWPTTEAYASYGNSSDLWGGTWSPSDVNASNFGVQISATMTTSTPPSVAEVDFVRITVYYSPAAAALYSDYLQGTNCGFTLTAGSTVSGILVEIKGLQTVANANTSLTVQLLKGGNLAGTAKTGTNLGLSNAFVSFGGTSDLWGTSWSASDINSSTFGVSIQAVDSTSGSVSFSVDFVRVTIYGTGGPTVSLTGTGLTATNGYQYVFCYGNSATGHVSSPTPASAVLKPSNQSIQVSLTQSTDAQVNQIILFRSTDSVSTATNITGNAPAASNYYQVTAPFANSTQNYTDSTTDINLIFSSIAPFAGFNDRPNSGSGMQGLVYYAGRIWGFSNTSAGNQVFFSALEECVNGVPEESFVSGQAGNFWNFDEPVTGLAVAGNGSSQILLVFCPGRIYGISGNSLDTFRRFLISNRRGAVVKTAISSMGGMVAWLDSSLQIWATNGGDMQELSQDIRPDFVGLASADTSKFSLTFHAAGAFHWLVFSTGSKLYVYDLDTEQWMPPWSFACNFIYSGETAAGTYQLMAATSTRALMLSSTLHNDNGTTYTPILQTNLFPLVPDFSHRFSVAALGIYDEPSRTGYPTLVQVDTNNVTLADVSLCFDDDPFNSSTVYTSIFTNKQDTAITANRQNGNNLVQNPFPITQQNARWTGIKIKGQNADDNLKIYGWFLAYKNVRT